MRFSNLLRWSAPAAAVAGAPFTSNLTALLTSSFGQGPLGPPTRNAPSREYQILERS